MKDLTVAGIVLAAGLAATAAGAQDWGGFYAGLAVTTAESGIDLTGVPAPYTGDDSAAIGVFAGYNHVLSSNLVVGGELSYTDVDTSQFPPITPWYGEGLLQARARLGYAAGNAMPYVALGIAKTDAGVFGGPTTSETGYSLGLGTEFLVGTNMSVRAEYNRAYFSDIGENVFFPPDFADLEYEWVTIGAAWHF